jgi:hypothetical protein
LGSIRKPPTPTTTESSHTGRDYDRAIVEFDEAIRLDPIGILVVGLHQVQRTFAPREVHRASSRAASMM